MSSFSQWFVSYQKNQTIKQVTWLCGTEPVLIDDILETYRTHFDEDPWCYSSYTAGDDPDKDIWADIASHPVDGKTPRLVVVRSAEKLKHLDRIIDLMQTKNKNPLTHVVPLRAGGEARKRVLALSHAYIARMALRHFNDIGELGGIPSIHFAKWALIDGGERLLFLSNYDGSWESYLGDFIDKADIGLNLAWACTLGYPKTFLLALGGARDEERFKAWSRSCQQPTPIFYSAYPDLSVAAVNNNTWIRQALHGGGFNDLTAFFRRLS